MSACAPAGAESSPTECSPLCATSSAGTPSSGRAGPMAKPLAGAPEQVSVTREQPAALSEAENPLTAGLERLPVPATTLVIPPPTPALARPTLPPALYTPAHPG